MVAILDALYRDHGNIARLLDILDEELAVFDEAERPDYEVIRAIVDYFRIYPDRVHHPREDLVFARLAERAPEAAKTVGDLVGEHAEVSARLGRFAFALDQILGEGVMTRREFREIARDFVDGERRHMAAEEERFFPVALKALTEEDWAELDSTLSTEPDPLFRDDVREEFAALRRQIDRMEQKAREERAGKTPR
ncbi:hemerythrin domain-containing protein [Kaustia mangrovi]|uniref:Hemerythrin domain-containing protein n=1 Tax=Kaustia mangrovi TaxID=2593653 RepID=A0A7S8HAX5_9HYPH|nr:hemerythrin domain-containing protein [Kaustia mangrovi]QPC41894.1 hemerythrin domain-containing protein [Kaustia mangrovi]